MSNIINYGVNINTLISTIGIISTFEADFEYVII